MKLTIIGSDTPLEIPHQEIVSLNMIPQIPGTTVHLVGGHSLRVVETLEEIERQIENEDPVYAVPL